MKKISVLIIILILIGIVGWIGLRQIDTEQTYKDRVDYVVDGDTFELEKSGRVRLRDIDAYEAGTEKGKKATKYAQYLLAGCDFVEVTTQGHYGYYGRLLADIESCRGKDISKALLVKGVAEIYK